MAWTTLQNTDRFNCSPKEPDLDTLLSWTLKLETLIREENPQEIIIVFANRAGVEGDMVYAGTSAVIGIKAGRVICYGILGREEQKLLFADTEKPLGHMVYQDTEHRDDISELDLTVSIAEEIERPPRQSPGIPKPCIFDHVEIKPTTGLSLTTLMRNQNKLAEKLGNTGSQSTSASLQKCTTPTADDRRCLPDSPQAHCCRLR
jgi:hypothetical protein